MYIYIYTYTCSICMVAVSTAIHSHSVRALRVLCDRFEVAQQFAMEIKRQQSSVVEDRRKVSATKKASLSMQCTYVAVSTAYM